MAINLAFADPAIHITDQVCGLADGNGNFVSTTEERTVVTSSGMIYLIDKRCLDRYTF